MRPYFRVVDFLLTTEYTENMSTGEGMITSLNTEYCDGRAAFRAILGVVLKQDLFQVWRKEKQ